ncbi:uncharacterized protein BDV14DRAFT_195758 [Aspergillus stella-maris]|uniref:uncharacterized protein n=1 Tax=Aspergillus stella-maris TaxID=1810926 RepID=UPI003CCCE808
MVKDTLHTAHPEGALIPPLIVEQISQEPAMVEEASNLKFIAFGGEDEMGITWEPIDDDKDVPEFYEMVIRRRSDMAQEQAVFANFPDLHEFHTKDTFRRHPTIPYYYKHQSRKDDVISFSTSEKTNPIDVEGRIFSLPGVGACLVIGHKRPYPILLIELVPIASSDEVLPHVHQALEELNKFTEKHAQIDRGDILIAVLEKLFALEIEALYSSATVRQKPALQVLTELDPSTNESLETSIAAMVGGLTGVEGLRVDDDFFAKVLDSRQVQVMAAALALALSGRKDMPFLRNAVYMNPTARGLVEYIRRDAAGKDSATTTSDALLNKYKLNHTHSHSHTHPKLHQNPSIAQRPPSTFSLTGSTGFVGTSILQALLQRSDITEITCIDRRIPTTKPEDTIVNGSTPRVTRYVADLSQPSLGLPGQAYSHLLSTVTTIIHVQWPVTFNLPLPLFEPQLAGVVVNLIHLAYNAPRTPRVDKPVPVPETALDNPRYALGAYAESKLLASRLLDRAASVSGVHSAICRVGQVAGSVKPSLQGTGIWPSRDWFPTLLRASQVKGVLPRSPGGLNHVDWIPVDAQSEALVTLALDLEIVPTIERRLDSARQGGSHGIEKIEVVDTLAEWTERLAAWNPPSSSAADAKPGTGAEEAEATMTAAKALLEFYEWLAQDADKPSVVLDTTKTAGRIPALKDVGPISGDWIHV